MSIAQLPLREQSHNNQQLFSDHYLNTILPERPDWKMLASDAQHTLEQIRPIVERYARHGSTKEAQTEHERARPLLEILGHTYEVQAALKTPKGTKRPDYVFYRDTR